jgi:hypothetical protein
LGSFGNFHVSGLGENVHRQRGGDVFAQPAALQPFKLVHGAVSVFICVNLR